MIKLRKSMSLEWVTPTVDATTFQRDFGRYQDEAHREPVKVTSHGRVIGGFLSTHDLAHHEQLKRRERQVYTAGESPTTSSMRLKKPSISSLQGEMPGSTAGHGDPL